MDKSCGEPKCPKQASHKCTCKKEFKFCKKHMEEHSAMAGCYIKAFHEGAILHIIRKKQNALKNLSLESIQLARFMNNEINTCLEENLVCISKKENQIYNFIINRKNEEADNIIAWAESLRLVNRNRANFIKNTKNLLCIDFKSENEITEIEKLEEKIEKLKSDYQKARNKIKVQKQKLAEYEKMYESNQNEIKKITNNYNETRRNLSILEDQLKDWENCCQDIDKIIQDYEVEKVSNIKKYDEACYKINILENELAQVNNLVQEKDIIIKSYDSQKIASNNLFESEIRSLKAFLDKSDSKIKQLEIEISECNKTIQDKQAEIEQYKIDLQSKQMSLDHAEFRIQILENDTTNKSIEETKEIENQNISKSPVIMQENNFQASKLEFVNKFRGMNQVQRKDYLIQKNYPDFEKDIPHCNAKSTTIKMTDDEKYIFICIF
ncbi:hypothetical protein SteCoe_39069 [Stentor coeruleus]|uniref:Uncharacterized protein n=1 Tax=Stentor coeruleus TaxID=5963 RepID=A0A1R2AKW3_9CILI|nr:hypothetical protein SteCoe_39069 [Stentor coeruleus]